MVILIDPPAWPAHGTLWSHLISDTSYDELHEFASRLGVPRRGFDLDHYDVPAAMHEHAVELGALAVSAKDIVHSLRDSGLRVRQSEREAITPLRRRQYLVAEWQQLGLATGAALPGTRERAAPQGWNNVGADLIARWNEPHRSYHDERHLEDVLLAINQLQTRGEQVAHSTLLAAWFHDAVYEGTAGSDERDSAHLAVASLQAIGLDPTLTEFVGELILATTPMHRIEHPPTPLVHLLDADLSIFAASPQRYERYAASVRLEYSHVSPQDFAAGRAEILDSYLSMPTIYRSPAAQALWESRARANLTREIALLRAT